MAHPPRRPEPVPARPITEQIRGLWGYGRRALALVWATNRRLGILLGTATVLGGVLPAAAAWIGKRLVDAIVLGISAHAAGTPTLEAATPALEWIVAEAGVMALLAANQRAISVIQSLLQAQLGHRVNVMILEKAVQLELTHFEDPDFYDKLTRARREASSRPLSLVMRTFGLIQNTISLVAYAGLLLGFSPWAVVVLVLAGVPAFVVEAKFSGSAFRLFRWRSPETRRQNYLEMVLSNDQYAKEVQVFGFGPLLLERYRDIFSKLYQADRDLTIRRAWWGFSLGLLGTAAFYGIYAWIGIAAVTRRITLGDMTMYILLFKQGQSAVAASLAAIGGMYEDNLYLSTLYEYLEQPIVPRTGGALVGPAPGSGLVFEGVSFTYPGSERPAVADIDLTLRRGEALALVGENGSGKTTLIKLLAGLYRPDRGRILLDGLPLEAWDTETLRRRIAIVFQDYGRYQLLAGENVGIGDPIAVTEEERWRQAATLGMAAPFLEALPEGYNTQLGRWFGGGRELSGGQWQKVALSRAFMRRDADILVLDEPTAAMDAEAEAIVFEHVRRLSRERAVILISHRFSTVRMADHIVVLEDGRIVERGSHEELIAQAGRYARLFELQATGYR